MTRTDLPLETIALPGRRVRRTCRGLSLVEVLVALLLLAVGLGGAMGLVTRQVTGLDRTQNGARADALARGRLVQLQAVGYGALNERYLRDTDTAYFGDKAEHRSSADAWWSARLTKAQPAGPGIEAIRIAVTVGWGSATPRTENGPKKNRDLSKTREVTGYVVAP